MQRIDTAREILTALELRQVRARRNEYGQLALKPADKVTPAVQEQCREYAPELLAILDERLGADVVVMESPPSCWRCGAGRTPPDLDEQIATLKYEHEKRPPVWHWGDREWARLRELLRPGDLIAVALGRANTPFYASVVVIRDGKFIEIARKDLLDS